MRFGNADANILLMVACQSQHWCGLDGYWDTFAGTDFSMWNGFHGDMFIGSDDVGRLEDYIIAAEANGVGSDWVDLMTDIQLLGWEEPDQCATSFIRGNTASQCDDQYNNAGFKDFHQPTNHNAWRWWHWCDCDPVSGEALDC
jgi:hypothetical protein